MRASASNRARKLDAARWFFPLASVYAALAVPLSVLAMTSTAWPPGLVGLAHGREMFFGFGLALVAGYLLGPIPVRWLWGLVALWLLARVTGVLIPTSPAAQWSSPLFALVLGALVIPRFRKARKWRNRALLPLLAGIALMPLLWWLGPRLAPTTLTALLFAALMLFMGGRFIAPAAAGAFQERGRILQSRVQPRIEGALLVALFLAAAGLLVGGGRWAGVPIIVAGALAMVRLLRWRLWHCRRTELWAAGLGYGWVALGLVALGLALAQGAWQRSALHIITVGGLGTLATAVMARQHYQRRWKSPPPAAPMLGAMALMSLATLSRLAAEMPLMPRSEWLWLAGASWSISFIWLVTHLLRRPESRDGRGRHDPGSSLSLSPRSRPPSANGAGRSSR